MRGEAGEAARATGGRVARTIGLQLAGRGATILVGLVTLPLLVRTLGPERFGIWTTALAYVGLFSAVTEFGLASAATLKMAAEPEHEAEWLGALAGLRTALAGAATLLAALGVPLVLRAEGSARTVGLVLCLTILAQGSAALLSVFQSRLRGGIGFGVALLQSALWLAAVGALAALGAGLVAFAAGLAVVSGVVAAAQLALVRPAMTAPRIAARRRAAPLLRLALPIGLTGVLSTIYYRLDAVLLYRLDDVREAGAYGAAVRVLDPLVLLPVAVMSAFFPVASAAWGRDQARVRRIVQTCLDLLVALAVPAVATAWVLADPVVRLLFGADYARTAEVLPILVLAFAAICLANLAAALAPLAGITWRVVGFAAVGVVVNVGLNLLLIPEHGGVGAAWATVATEVLTCVLALTAGLRVLGLRPALGRAAGALAAGALMAGAMLATRGLGLAPALLVGALVYPAALLGSWRTGPRELLALRARGI